MVWKAEMTHLGMVRLGTASIAELGRKWTASMIHFVEDEGFPWPFQEDTYERIHVFKIQRGRPIWIPKKSTIMVPSHPHFEFFLSTGVRSTGWTVCISALRSLDNGKWKCGCRGNVKGQRLRIANFPLSWGRLAVEIPFFAVFWKNIPGGCLGFLNHQQYAWCGTCGAWNLFQVATRYPTWDWQVVYLSRLCWKGRWLDRWRVKFIFKKCLESKSWNLLKCFSLFHTTCLERAWTFKSILLVFWWPFFSTGSVRMLREVFWRWNRLRKNLSRTIDHHFLWEVQFQLIPRNLCW